jgi:DNA repair exonuclease SbcCD ATPase subunit
LKTVTIGASGDYRTKWTFRIEIGERMSDFTQRDDSVHSSRHSQSRQQSAASIGTPARSSRLLTRLTDSSRKLDQFEKKQIEQLSAKLELQRKEFEKLQAESHSAKKLKLEYRAKLIEANRSFAGNVARLTDTLSSPNSTISDLVQKQNALINQLEKIHQTCLDPRELKKRIKELDAELASLKKPTSKSSSPWQPEDEGRLDESLRTMKIMKSQCLGIEEYLRNSVRFERDEAKAEIRRLLRIHGKLLKEVNSAKEAVTSFSTFHTPSQKYLDGFRLLTKACEELEASMETKGLMLHELKDKHAKELERLNDVIQSTETIEKEIKECEETILLEGFV